MTLFDSELNLLMGTEKVRSKMVHTILVDSTAPQVASEPIPEDLPRPDAEPIDAAANTEIEPIANRVPVECLYVRFGNFPNFLWLRHRLEDWGGQMRNIISRAGSTMG